ncbi:MAG: response regulator [Methanomicrobiales archaeon]|jgi:CheY-like chemotaxis protein|nr:response regulator [Methanomicrobiales archaeon]
MYTVLVVDDSPFIVDIFVTMLERGGYRTASAYSGKECLTLLRSLSPDLILLDIMMEPMDGWITLMEIKNNPVTRMIPVLMLTAKQLTPAEAQQYGIYIEDYIMKPITHRELYTAIEHVLEQKKTREGDIEMARRAGVDEALIGEYTRLSKSVDINRRLISLIESTYHVGGKETGEARMSEEIEFAVKSMMMNITFQEERLRQIKDTFAKSGS